MIEPIAPTDTHELRRSVLRDGTPSRRVEFDGDDDPATLHLGYRRDGTIVAISTWLPRPYAPRPALRAVQLRGMATSPSVRGTGIGSQLFRAGIDRFRRAGMDAVWARARDGAVPFYVSHGFEVVGDGYLDADTAVAHHDVILTL